MNDRAESIATWLERIAARHDEMAKTDLKHDSEHRGIALLYRARATDIRAGLDLD